MEQLVGFLSFRTFSFLSVILSVILSFIHSFFLSFLPAFSLIDYYRVHVLLLRRYRSRQAARAVIPRVVKSIHGSG